MESQNHPPQWRKNHNHYNSNSIYCLDSGMKSEILPTIVGNTIPIVAYSYVAPSNDIILRPPR